MKWVRLESILIIALTVATVVVTLLSYLAGLISLELATMISGFIVLIILNVTLLFWRRQANKALEAMKLIIDNLIVNVPKVLTNLRSKNLNATITWSELRTFIQDIALSLLTNIGLGVLEVQFKSIYSRSEEKCVKLLIQKLREDTLIKEEAEELKNLLEKLKYERRRKEMW